MDRYRINHDHADENGKQIQDIPRKKRSSKDMLQFVIILEEKCQAFINASIQLN